MANLLLNEKFMDFDELLFIQALLICYLEFRCSVRVILVESKPHAQKKAYLLVFAASIGLDVQF